MGVGVVGLILIIVLILLAARVIGLFIGGPIGLLLLVLLIWLLLTGGE